MPSLSASDILWLWEYGRDRHPIDRALLILGAAHPELSKDALDVLPVGRRDRQLLNIRIGTFGPEFDCCVTCPSCGSELEFLVQADDLNFHAGAGELDEPWICEPWSFRLRSPNSRDLADLVEAADTATAYRNLLHSCVVESVRDGQPVALDAVPERIFDKIETRIAEACPASEIDFDLNCPDCSHKWAVAFDIASFLWTEIGARARRLLLEVHTLARACGWREADILAMGPQRRQFYLDLAS
jgi:hypothetical protein